MKNVALKLSDSEDNKQINLTLNVKTKIDIYHWLS